MAAALRKLHPRRVREYAGEDPLEGYERTASTEGVALTRRLRAGSVHFGSYGFRTAFAEKCLDSGTLESLLRRVHEPERNDPDLAGSIAMLRAGLARRQCGISCVVGGRHGKVVFIELSALDAASAVCTEHGCNALGLAFAAHSLEDTGSERVVAEEAELLARTSYGLAYLTQALCQDLARGHGLRASSNSYAASAREEDALGLPQGCMLAVAEAYPRAGAEEGLMVENLWVFRERESPAYGDEAGPFAPPGGAWRLALAYGLVPEGAGSQQLSRLQEPLGSDPGGLKAARLRYKRQVTAAVRACALAGCDGLLVGCAEGVLGSEVAGHPAADMAADVWAEVLLGEGKEPGLAGHFRVVAFCLGGRANPRRAAATREAIQAAFAR